MRFLLSEIVDQVFLVAIHPASNGEQQELQRMRHRDRLLARDAGTESAVDDWPHLGRFFAPNAGENLVMPGIRQRIVQRLFSPS